MHLELKTWKEFRINKVSYLVRFTLGYMCDCVSFMNL
jgi:hypothetical protein